MVEIMTHRSKPEGCKIYFEVKITFDSEFVKDCPEHALLLIEDSYLRILKEFKERHGLKW